MASAKLFALNQMSHDPKAVHYKYISSRYKKPDRSLIIIWEFLYQACALYKKRELEDDVELPDFQWKLNL